MKFSGIIFRNKSIGVLEKKSGRKILYLLESGDESSDKFWGEMDEFAEA